MPLIALAAPPPTNPLTATSLNVGSGLLTAGSGAVGAVDFTLDSVRGWPTIYGADATYVSFVASGDGDFWGGTGLTAIQYAASPEFSGAMISVNDSVVAFADDNQWGPGSDASIDLGSATGRWDRLYATSMQNTGDLVFRPSGNERVTMSDIGGGLGALYLGPKASNDYIYGGNNQVHVRVNALTRASFVEQG